MLYGCEHTRSIINFYNTQYREVYSFEFCFWGGTDLFGLGLFSMGFDVFFMVKHYGFYNMPIQMDGGTPFLMGDEAGSS